MQNIYFIFFIEKIKYNYFSDYVLALKQYFNGEIILYDSKNINKYILDNINKNIIFIFLQQIPNFINKNIFLSNKYYILNTEQYTHTNLLTEENNLIDYSKDNIVYSNKYFRKKNILYFPYPINKQEIYNYNKIHDVCVICTLSEKRIKIINQIRKMGINVTVISNLFDFKRDEILMKHKILLNIHNSDSYKIFESLRCDRCIFNKMIVVSESSFRHKKNNLKKYVIFRKYNDLAVTVKKILDNYDKYYNLIFNNFDNFIANYNNNISKIYENNIKQIINNNMTKTKKFIQRQKVEKFGFIMIRNVIDEETNLYWQECYICIRKLYNDKIIIIDDSSDEKYLTQNVFLKNCKIIGSNYKQRGEILGYYYLFKYNFFEKAIIIHDSIFIKKKTNFAFHNNASLFIFNDHAWDDDFLILKILKKLKNINMSFYERKEWNGCFGIMSVINYDFLKKINDKYNFFDVIINNILNRDDRMALERVFGYILFLENNNTNSSILGDIHDYCEWGLTYDEYKNNNYNLPIIKIWSGR
jgi:hypothetical protein